MTEAELPAAVVDSIQSWRRVIGNARAEIAPDILLNAAVDLFRTRKIAKSTVSQDDYAIISLAIVDALHDMARAARVDDDGAQAIFARAQYGPVEQMNGHAAVDEPPPVGRDDYGADPASAGSDEPASLITAASWPTEAPPPVDWLVATRIPRGDVTSLHGDGGAGKTDIALRLAANVARDAPDWLNHEIANGAVVLISAEEPEREVQRRLWQHSQHDGYDFASLDKLHMWYPGADHDTTLAVPDRQSGIMRPTRLMQEIALAIAHVEPVLIVVDNVAATFAGNQNDRVNVRSYINLWRAIARGASKPAVLLLDHPSLSGLTSNTGRGGNMDWRNAVRSALYLHPPSEQAEIDRGIRILETAKSNYAPPGNPLRLCWSGSGLQIEQQPSSLHRLAKDAECDEAFLRLLDERNAQGRPVSDRRSAIYAPTVFAGMEGANGFTMHVLAQAMDRLFKSGKITLREEGPPSKRRSRIERVKPQGFREPAE